MQSWDAWWIVGWVVSNTIVAGLMGVVAFAADRWWKRPALSHVLWVLVLVKLLTPPVIPLPIQVDPADLSWLSQYQVHGHQSLADSRDDQRLNNVMVAMGQTESTSPRRGHFNGVYGALGVWLAGAIGLAAWVLLTSSRLNRLIQRQGRHDEPASSMAAALVEGAAQRAPPVWLVEAVISPMLVGTGRRTKILFPERLWQSLDPQSRQLLLAHELEHWRRRDSLVRYLEAIAWIVLWWHPLVWIARSQIENCEERCCDMAAARRAGAAPRVYAEAILATLDFLAEPATWRNDVGCRPVASALGRLPQMEQRLRDIMTVQSRRRLGVAGVAAIVVIGLLVPVHPWFVFNRGAGTTGIQQDDSGVLPAWRPNRRVDQWGRPLSDGN